MSNIVLRTSALAVALTGLALADLKACPEIKPAEKLTLKSHYTGKVIVDGARQIFLTVTMDSKKGGSGTLTFDPNIYENGTATQIAIHNIAIRMELVPNEDHAAKGRRLYALKRDGVDDFLGRARLQEEPARWFLAIPEEDGMPAWLILADHDGKFQDIIVLE
jgi:hypothetical protein